ncbi:MAG: site-specific DNA-methyltransferase, partial [Campylobacterota bacterium]|nr:site-specific DNA-methyltransferase [Campylobacterota bacterium]
IKFDNYQGYSNGNIIYFMDKGLTTKDIQSLINKLDEDNDFQPSKIVLFGYNIQSKHQRELQEAIKNYTNKKSIELDMVVRY